MAAPSAPPAVLRLHAASGEVVELPEAELPASGDEMVGFLKEIVAPLPEWCDVAAVYFRRGNYAAFEAMSRGMFTAGAST
jgi:hypothetical protein